MVNSKERYYRVSINGYGGESAYMSISQEAHDFWTNLIDEHGDSDLVTYMLSDYVEEVEYESIDSVPEEAQFLHDVDDDNYKRPWYESHTEFEHTHGAEYSSAKIYIDEVDSDDWDATAVDEIIHGEDLQELNEQINEESDQGQQFVEMGCCEKHEGNIAQLYSSEKGCFFEGTITTHGEFDINKLKLFSTEYLNGEDTITCVEYDGEEIYNDGSETEGKCFYASVWNI